MKWPPLRRADTVFARLLLIVLAGIACTHLLITTLLIPAPPPPAAATPADGFDGFDGFDACALPTLAPEAMLCFESRPRPVSRPGPDAAPPAPPPRPGGAPRNDRPQPPPRPDAATHREPPGPPPGQDGGIPPVYRIIALECVTLAIAAWIGARLLSRPMRRLAAAAMRIGEDLDVPALTESGPYEARQAAAAFNRMQGRLRHQLDERGRFLAAVSHDLRTPLTRLRLRVERLPADDGREALIRELAGMHELLDATLDYLRGERSGESRACLDLQALVETLADDAGEHGVTVPVAGRVAPIETLPLTLRRCLQNLLDNALRHGGSAGFVLTDGPDAVCIDLRDHGPGIPEADLQRVFEPYVRLDASRSRATGGVGLGLSIARDAARHLGGTLTLANAPGGGLLARLRLSR